LLPRIGLIFAKSLIKNENNEYNKKL